MHVYLCYVCFYVMHVSMMLMIWMQICTGWNAIYFCSFMFDMFMQIQLWMYEMQITIYMMKM